MTIYPLYTAQQDTSRTEPGLATPYDTVWAQTEIPAKAPSALERVMLAEDKLYVVLGVVLIIWIGIVFFLFRTDRKLHDLERNVEARIPERTGEI